MLHHLLELAAGGQPADSWKGLELISLIKRQSGERVKGGLVRNLAFLVLAATSWSAASDTPWLDIPFVRQIRAGCGSAAVAMVMQYWVQHKPDLDAAAAAAERIDQALPPSSKGISGKELQRYLQENGFSAYIFDGEIADLRQHVAKGRPTIVCLGLKGADGPLHFAVVAGVGDTEVLLNDPTRGKLFRENLSTFRDAWKATGNWTLLAVPRQKP